MPVCVLSVLIGLPWRIVHLGQRWAGGGTFETSQQTSLSFSKILLTYWNLWNCDKTGEKPASHHWYSTLHIAMLMLIKCTFKTAYGWPTIRLVVVLNWQTFNIGRVCCKKWTNNILFSKVFLIKQDGVGPVDNRPSADKNHHFVKKIYLYIYMWHRTCDIWHLTPGQRVFCDAHIDKQTNRRTSGFYDWIGLGANTVRKNNIAEI